MTKPVKKEVYCCRCKVARNKLRYPTCYTTELKGGRILYWPHYFGSRSVKK